eukprot:gene6637-13447_t
MHKFENSTFKPILAHEVGSKLDYLHQYTKATLGSGNMRLTVQLPAGEELNEWFAANTIDFFNDISLIWGIVCSAELPPQGPGEGFPEGVEYCWADGVNIVSPIRCSAVQYVDYVMTWVEELLNNDSIFPPAIDYRFSSGYSPVLKQIFTRLFRIYAIIYTNHFNHYEEVGAVAHLNTCFKHFLFFVWEYNIVDERDLLVLEELTTELKQQYETQGKEI